MADAYCPHLGAHLASADGAACDGKLICPFHKWQFDGATGGGVDIPYSTVKVPSNVRLTLFPTREVDSVVVIRYHPDGAEPLFEPFDAVLQRGDGKWLNYITQAWETTCPFRDILENLFGTEHIVQLHNATALPEIRAFEPTPYGLRIVQGRSRQTTQLSSIFVIDGDFALWIPHAPSIVPQRVSVSVVTSCN